MEATEAATASALCGASGVGSKAATGEFVEWGKEEVQQGEVEGEPEFLPGLQDNETMTRRTRHATAW